MATPGPRVVFARIGWMERYEGPSLAEPRPRRGGRYNEEGNVGNEAFNFQRLDGKLYGYFQSPGEHSGLDLSRIDPSANGDLLTDVRIIWVATKDDGGQVVVGWYDKATLFDRACEYPDGSSREDYWYKCITNPEDAVLLPLDERVWNVPSGRNGFGQANVLYAIGDDGQPRLQSDDYVWMSRILQQIDAYSTTTDADRSLGAIVAAAGGQGFVGDPAWRTALDKHAMQAAIHHFKAEGYDPKDEHTGHPYDIRCTRAKEEVFVEVKGTTTAGESLLVTSGEVRFAREKAPNTALFVLHSVERGPTGGPAGGKIVVVRPWNPTDDSLSAIAYTYARAL